MAGAHFFSAAWTRASSFAEDNSRRGLPIQPLLSDCDGRDSSAVGSFENALVPFHDRPGRGHVVQHRQQGLPEGV